MQENSSSGMDIVARRLPVKRLEQSRAISCNPIEEEIEFSLGAVVVLVLVAPQQLVKIMTNFRKSNMKAVIGSDDCALDTPSQE